MSPATRRPGLRPASGPSRADFEGRTVCARFARRTPRAACPRPCRGAVARARRRRLDVLAGPRRVHGGRAAHPRAHRGRRGLPGQPLPGAVRARCRARSADVDALTALLARGNPAPYAGTIRLPGARRGDRHRLPRAVPAPRRRRTVESGPIKGTGRTEADLLAKDHAENVMIVDLVRNDLGRVCATGTRDASPSCARSRSTPAWSTWSPRSAASCAPDAGWPELLAADVPARLGHRRAQVQRPADHRRAGDRAPRPVLRRASAGSTPTGGTGELAVGIRTFWIDRTRRRGAAALRHRRRASPGARTRTAEWAETELKAARLLAVASGAYDGRVGEERTA